MIGPATSAIDTVRYRDIGDTLAGLRVSEKNLVIDGYILRNQLQAWVADLDKLQSDGWHLHLELVPHSIWTKIRKPDLETLSYRCTTISSSISTVERILGIEPVETLTPQHRANRIVDACGPFVSAGGCTMVLRFGFRASEFALMMRPATRPSLRQYPKSSLRNQTANQDRLFIGELLGGQTREVTWLPLEENTGEKRREGEA